MARTQAIGDGPIVFFDDGRQVFLPVDDVYFDGVAVGATSEASAGMTRWLEYLVAQKRLSPSPTPSPGAAMLLTAAAEGSNGNNIEVRVSANGAAKVDISVTETAIYEGLSLDPNSPDYPPKVLGEAGAPGTRGKRPGLVRVQPITGGAPPDPAEGTVDMESPVVDHTPTWKVPAAAGGGDSFTLVARGPGSDTAQAPHQPKWRVQIADVVRAAGGTTFTLEVVWSNTVTVDQADLAVDPPSKLDPLAFAVAVTKPDGSSRLRLPRTGSVSLRGGAEPRDAVKAKATLLASA
jgi:hypothetical protein